MYTRAPGFTAGCVPWIAIGFMAGPSKPPWFGSFVEGRVEENLYRAVRYGRGGIALQGGNIRAQKVPVGLSLGPGESVLWYGRPSWKSLWPLFVLAALTLIAFGLGLLFFLVAVILHYSNEYAITNKRIYARAGLLRKLNIDTPLDKVTEVVVSQGVMGRILTYGNLAINTTGGGGIPLLLHKFVLRGVDNPESLRATVRNLIDQYQAGQRATERLERIHDQLLTGQISQAQYENASRQILSGMAGAAPINPPAPPPSAPAVNPGPIANPAFTAGNQGSGFTPQRFCTRCGAPLMGGATFCGSCGFKLR